MHDLGRLQRAIALTCQGKQLIDALLTNSRVVVSRGDTACFVNMAALEFDLEFDLEQVQHMSHGFSS